MSEEDFRVIVPRVKPNDMYTMINNYHNVRDQNNESNINQFQQKTTDININLHNLILKQNDEIQLIKSQLEPDIKDLKNKYDKLYNMNITNQQKINKMQAEIQKIPGELIWKIFNHQNQTSDSFYNQKNGYKMRLNLTTESFWMSHEWNLTLEMAQTDENNKLPWPNEFDVRIGLIDQSSGDFLQSEKQVILFNNPTSIHKTPFKFSMNRFSRFWIKNVQVIKCTVS